MKVLCDWRCCIVMPSPRCRVIAVLCLPWCWAECHVSAWVLPLLQVITSWVDWPAVASKRGLEKRYAKRKSRVLNTKAEVQGFPDFSLNLFCISCFVLFAYRYISSLVFERNLLSWSLLVRISVSAYQKMSCATACCVTSTSVSLISRSGWIN